MENQDNITEQTEQEKTYKGRTALKIIISVLIIILGTLGFVFFSGLGNNVINAVKENGLSFNSIWKGMNVKNTALTEPETETFERKEAPADAHLEGGSVYVKDNVTYIRADIDIKDEKIVDSEDPAYRVRVNLACQCVTVYKIINETTETAVRAFPCSTAREGHETPEGVYPLLETYDWCFLEDGSYAQYAMRIGGEIGDGYMFHTVPYEKEKKDTLEWYEYDKLGQEASLGCIRIPVGEMYWLREHVSTGGEVVIYSDINNPGALGMPETYFIPEEVTEARGWDPTDPDSNNPWHLYDFTLNVPDEIVVPASKEGLDITEYVSAQDIYGHDLSKYVKYQNGNNKYGFSYIGHNYDDPAEYTDGKGNIDYDAIIECRNKEMDISRPGTYEIKVSISIGPLSASRTIPLTVN